ncbi:MAG TPA: hypothetical protein VLM89_01465 [Phycisphaerae bacterium]|nr:hypothetical protein [Phycisphaerae bacterium]
MSAPTPAEKNLMVMRLVVGAILAGLLAFWCVVLFISGRFPERPELEKPMAAALILVAVVATVLPMIIYRPMVNKARQALAQAGESADPAAIAAPHLFLYTLVSAGLGEALGFFAAIVHLLTGYPSAWLMALLAVVLIARRFPTARTLDDFTADM